MKWAKAIFFGALAWFEIASAQGLDPEDALALASFPLAPLERGIRNDRHVMLEGIPRPGNQWRTSTCVAWAVAYAAGSYFHRHRNEPLTTVLSPAFSYAVGNGDARCLATSRVSRMLDMLRDVGGLPMSEYAYDPGWCGRTPTAAELQRAAAFRIPGWAAVPSHDVTASKSQIASGRVVIFSMGVGPAFAAHSGPSVFDTLETGPDIYGHAMVALGFDDERQAFRIQNSVGTGWGDNGQAWLSYHVWQDTVITAYVITDAPVAQTTSIPLAQGTILDRLVAALPSSMVRRVSVEDQLHKYIDEKIHRAFAFSMPDGGTWREGGWSKAEIAQKMALERCQIYFGRPCTLFAVDDEIQADPSGASMPQDMPRVSFTGAYNLANIPGLSDRVRNSLSVASYGSASAPKAMAIHPTGIALAVLSAADQREAESEALRLCNSGLGRDNHNGPCYLYAASNKVVLFERRTTARLP